MGETLCIAEYCAGNFPNVVQRSAPTPSVPSPLDALTNAKRLVCSMPSKAPVRRRSGAYPLLLDDKSVRLTVLFQILSAAQRLPLSRHLSRNDREQMWSCRGQKQHRRQSWLYFQELPQQSQLQYESAIDNTTTVTFPIQEFSISASQVRITMKVPFTVSPVSSRC